MLAAPLFLSTLSCALTLLSALPSSLAFSQSNYTLTKKTVSSGSGWQSLTCANVAGSYRGYSFNFGCLCEGDVHSFCQSNGGGNYLENLLNQYVSAKSTPAHPRLLVSTVPDPLALSLFSTLAPGPATRPHPLTSRRADARPRSTNMAPPSRTLPTPNPPVTAAAATLAALSNAKTTARALKPSATPDPALQTEDAVPVDRPMSLRPNPVAVPMDVRANNNVPPSTPATPTRPTGSVARPASPDGRGTRPSVVLLVNLKMGRAETASAPVVRNSIPPTPTSASPPALNPTGRSRPPSAVLPALPRSTVSVSATRLTR